MEFKKKFKKGSKKKKTKVRDDEQLVLDGEYIYVFINKICVTAFTIARVIKGLPNSRYEYAA